MSVDSNGFTQEQRAELTRIWEQLYELYLQRGNGLRDGVALEAEISALIEERDAIRPWGWSTGRNWKDDIPPEELKKMRFD
jgi:hypothetical protein